MVQSFTSYEVDNDKRFQDALEESLKRLGSLKIPLKLISSDFYKSEKAIFKLKSSGKYPDFGGFTPKAPAFFQGEIMPRMTAYRLRKKHEVGFDYPLLKRSGDLMRSITALEYLWILDFLPVVTSV